MFKSFVGKSNAISSPKSGEGESESADDEDDEYEDDEDEDEDEEEGDEGSGIDVGEETLGTKSPRISTDGSFAGHGSNLTEDSWTNVKFPPLQTNQPRKDLFGEVHFPPKQADNERSPSPERRIPTGPLRSRDMLPPPGSSIAAGQKIVLPRSMKQTNPAVSLEQRQQEEDQRIARKAAQKRAQEQQPLEDVEDDIVKKLLESSIEGTTELEDFIAHQDYTATVTKAGIPGQIEKIYRDINSMIDTLGLNCRNIQRFTKGHEEGVKDERKLEDLDKPTSWTLAEIRNLDKLENGLSRTLENAQLRDVQRRMHAMQYLQQDITKLLVQQKELRATADVHLDSTTNNEQYRDLDLSSEQQFQRQDLQSKIKTFQTNLTEAESALAILRTKLATAGTNFRNGGGSQKVPTMEAVSNTVRKMTSKIEEKSGDIDVLEARMQKLGIDASTPSASRNVSRHGSPLPTTPPSSSSRNHRSAFLSSIGGGGGGGPNNHTSPLRNTWRSSVNGLNSSVNSNTSNTGPRLLKVKKLAEYTAEDIEPFVRRAERRKVLMGFLRDTYAGKEGEKVVKPVDLD